MSSKRDILIVEDDPSIMKAEVFALKEAGFKVDMAVNGAEALKLIRDKHYAVILLDLVMPQRTGFDVLTELKFMKCTVPILVLSNMFEAVSREEALRLGARDYIQKTAVSIDDVVDRVKKFSGYDDSDKE